MGINPIFNSENFFNFFGLITDLLSFPSPPEKKFLRVQEFYLNVLKTMVTSFKYSLVRVIYTLGIECGFGQVYQGICILSKRVFSPFEIVL